MKRPHHSEWTSPYLPPRRARINFFADTRQGRRSARRNARLRRMATRIFLFALVLILGIYALGWALSVAPTMQ